MFRKKKNKKLMLSAFALALTVPTIVAPTIHSFAAESQVTSDLTIKDRQIVYPYRTDVATSGVKWATDKEKVAMQAAITTNGELFYWKEKPAEPIQVLKDKKFKAVASNGSNGMNDFVALTEDGEVYTWQYNISAVKKVAGLTGVKQISALSGGFLALTENGDVYAWGSNSNGALGLGDKNYYNQPPTKILSLNGIVSIDSESNRSFALTSSGDVYAWGSNLNGMAGLPSEISYYTPTKIGGLTGVKVLEAGANGAGALTADGKIYLWGDLAYFPGKIPTLVGTEPNALDIEVGHSSFFLLLKDKTIQAWGKDNDGALGDGDVTQTTVAFAGRKTIATDIAVLESKYRTSTAVTSNGDMLTWGDSDGFLLAHGYSQPDYTSPTPLANVYVDKPLTVTFNKLNDSAVEISWEDMQNATKYVVKKNGVVVHDHTSTNFADSSVIVGVKYTYEFTFTNALGTYTKTMEYTHGEEPVFDESGEPASDNPLEGLFSLWSADNPDAKFVTSIIPRVTVIGGKSTSGLLLDNVDLKITEPIITDLGKVVFTNDGDGNTVVSFPDGLGTPTTNETLSVKLGETEILKVVIKPKPVLNFSF